MASVIAATCSHSAPSSDEISLFLTIAASEREFAIASRLPARTCQRSSDLQPDRKGPKASRVPREARGWIARPP